MITVPASQLTYNEWVLFSDHVVMISHMVVIAWHCSTHTGRPIVPCSKREAHVRPLNTYHPTQQPLASGHLNSHAQMPLDQ